MAKKTSPIANIDLELAQQTVKALEAENTSLKEKAARAIADYQNLERRQQVDQVKILDYARITIFESLLQPLEHLSLAAKNINDKGLDMVITQFWQILNSQGLEELSPLGQDFDLGSMEAVEKEGEGTKVTAVLSPGYQLNDIIIKPAKVKVG